MWLILIAIALFPLITCLVMIVLGALIRLADLIGRGEIVASCVLVLFPLLMILVLVLTVLAAKRLHRCV